MVFDHSTTPGQVFSRTRFQSFSGRLHRELATLWLLLGRVVHHAPFWVAGWAMHA